MSTLTHLLSETSVLITVFSGCGPGTGRGPLGCRLRAGIAGTWWSATHVGASRRGKSGDGELVYASASKLDLDADAGALFAMSGDGGDAVTTEQRRESTIEREGTFVCRAGAAGVFWGGLVNRYQYVSCVDGSVRELVL